MLARLDLLDALSQEDAPALAVCLWFYYESSLLSVELFAKFAVLGGQQPGLWKEVVVLRRSFEHVHQAETEQILPGKDMDTRKVADLLKEMKPDEQIGLNVMVGPKHVPGTVALHGVLHLPAELIGDFLDDIVVRD